MSGFYKSSFHYALSIPILSTPLLLCPLHSSPLLSSCVPPAPLLFTPLLLCPFRSSSLLSTPFVSTPPLSPLFPSLYFLFHCSAGMLVVTKKQALSDGLEALEKSLVVSVTFSTEGSTHTTSNAELVIRSEEHTSELQSR